MHVSKTMPRAVLAPTLKFTPRSENEQPVANYLIKKNFNFKTFIFYF